MECISITYDKSEHDLTALTSFCFDREKKVQRMMTGYVGEDAEDIINIVSNQGFIKQYRRDIYNQALEDFERKIKECCSIVGSCDFEDMAKIKEQLTK